MHIVFAILSAFAAIDFVVGTVRFFRAIRRQRAVSPSGEVIVESLRHYAGRMLRPLARPVLILAVLVLGYLAILHFGPLKPIHEW